MENNFGEFVRELRKSKRLTLVQLAEKTGLSQPYLSQIENNKRGMPSQEIIENLSKALEVDYLTLLKEAGYLRVVKTGYYEEFKDILEEEKELVRNKDILHQLKNNERVYYNNQILSNEDRNRVLTVLEALLHEYHK